MKWIHLGDLHIGKTVAGFSMLEDQQFIFRQIINYVHLEQVDAVLIAGDVYDKALPGAEAVKLCDRFLTELCDLGVSVLVISGNHDSPERLAFAREILQKQGLYMAGSYQGQLERVDLEDRFGTVHFYFLPFTRPGLVKRYLGHEGIESYQDAVQAVLESAQLDQSARNVLLSHQFYAGSGSEPERSESETGPVGGLDRIDSSMLEGFDYVALGHLHGPQQIGRETIRYAGSPLKYSFSEVLQRKSIPLVELREKGDITITLLPLNPLRDLRRLKGPLAALLGEAVAGQGNREDYLQVILTDEQELHDAIGKLREAYPNVMSLGFENQRTRAEADWTREAQLEQKNPFQLFEEFYAMQNGSGMEPEEARIVLTMLNELGGGR